MAHMPVLSFRDSLLFDVFCALAVHKVYSKYEVEPANVAATLALLFGVPALPCYFLMSHIGTTTVAVILTYTLFYASLALSIVLYRISPLHPLAKYPGPVPMKISKLVLSYYASTGKQYRIFKNLHDKYGPIVRIGPNELSIVDVESIPPIAGLRKNPQWTAHAIPGMIPSLPAMRSVELHDVRRKLWNRGFTTAALKELQPAVEKRVLELVEELGKRASPFSGGKETTLDLSQWMGNFTYDVMGDMVLNSAFSLLRKGDEDGVRALLINFVDVIAVLQHTPWIAGLVHKLSVVPDRMRKFQEFAFRCYDMRKSQGATKRDLFHYITNEEGLEEFDVPRDQGMNDVLAAIGGGGDTTYSVLSAIFYYLLLNPSTHARLRKEVDSQFPIGEGDAFDTLKLARMPYLNAVINEALRLQPAVPTSLQRCPLEGSAGVIVAGRLVPESTIVYLPPYPHHRDKRYFSPSPDSFIPERWLGTDNEKFTTNTSAFIPFAAGRANCVGKNLALMEMRMVVATLIQRFEMKFAEGYDPLTWEEDLKEAFIMKVGKLPIVLRARC